MTGADVLLELALEEGDLDQLRQALAEGCHSPQRRSNARACPAPLQVTAATQSTPLPKDARCRTAARRETECRDGARRSRSGRACG